MKKIIFLSFLFIFLATVKESTYADGITNCTNIGGGVCTSSLSDPTLATLNKACLTQNKILQVIQTNPVNNSICSSQQPYCLGCVSQCQKLGGTCYTPSTCVLKAAQTTPTGKCITKTDCLANTSSGATYCYLPPSKVTPTIAPTKKPTPTPQPSNVCPNYGQDRCPSGDSCLDDENGRICGGYTLDKSGSCPSTGCTCYIGPAFNHCYKKASSSTPTPASGGGGNPPPGSSSTCQATINQSSEAITFSSNNTVVTATVTAGSAKRVDASFTLTDSNKQVTKYAKNEGTTGGPTCAGTKCTFTATLNKAFPKITSGQTYQITAFFNSWNECGSTFNNQTATKTVSFTYGSSTNPSPTGPTPTGPTATPGNANVSAQFDFIDSQDQAVGRIPNHKRRHFTIFLYKDEGYKVDPNGDNATYKITNDIFFTKGDPTNTSATNSTYGIFTNNAFPLTGVAAGSYYVFGKTEGSLREPLTPTPQKMTINPSTGVTLDFTQGSTQLIPMGDISSNDNTISTDDYNAILSCYGSKMTGADCQNFHLTDDIFTTTPWADLNDDGKVDGIDYNIFIRNFVRNNSGI